MKVLFISAPIGSGHVKAAHAVGEALRDIDSSITIRFANVFDFFPSAIGNTILKCYLKVLSVFPKAYAAAYGWGNSSRLALAGRKLISHYLAQRMYHFIEEFQPDAVVCTHATPAGLVADLIRRKQLRVPGIAIVTDFVLHRLWVYPELTYYCVADEDLRRELAAVGIPMNRSIASGIPISKRFTAINHTAKFAPFSIMIMGGGAGVMPIDLIIKELDSITLPMHFIAICGNNQMLREKLLEMSSDLSHSLQVFGFVDTVPELMSSADILITKPGGMTSAEALCCGIPLILYRPIPGQEEANAATLIRKNVAVRADSLDHLRKIVNEFINGQTSLCSMRTRSLAFSKPLAASYVADLILQLAHETIFKTNKQYHEKM